MIVALYRWYLCCIYYIFCAIFGIRNKIDFNKQIYIIPPATHHSIICMHHTVPYIIQFIDLNTAPKNHIYTVITEFDWTLFEVEGIYRNSPALLKLLPLMLNWLQCPIVFDDKGKLMIYIPAMYCTIMIYQEHK